MPNKWYKQWEEEVIAKAAMVWKVCLERPRALTAQQRGKQGLHRMKGGQRIRREPWLGKRARVQEVINWKAHTPVKWDYSYVSLSF